jgi:nitrous oxidase accessory protein NosD
MKTRPFAPRGLLAAAFLSVAQAATSLRAADGPPVVAKPAVNAAVTVTDNGRAWTLDNGIVKAVIDKRNGDMNSLFYK